MKLSLSRRTQLFALVVVLSLPGAVLARDLVGTSNNLRFPVKPVLRR